MNEQRQVTRQEQASRQSAQSVQQAAASRQREQTLLPPVDVIEDKNGITLYADLPGVPKDKLQVEFEADTLTIEGEVAVDTPENMNSSYAEVRQPRYRRSFTLSRDLDGGNATAEFRHAVLTLRIPKADHAQPRRIEVRVA